MPVCNSLQKKLGLGPSLSESWRESNTADDHDFDLLVAQPSQGEPIQTYGAAGSACECAASWLLCFPPHLVFTCACDALAAAGSVRLPGLWVVHAWADFC